MADGLASKLTDMLLIKVTNLAFENFTEEEIECINKFVKNKLFLTENMINGNTIVEQGYRYNSNITLSEKVQGLIVEKTKNILLERIDEILSSAECQKYINNLADNILKESLSTFEKQMTERIVERLIGNSLNSEICMNNVPLRVIINDELNKRIH